MNPDFVRLENLRQQLVKNATAHAWSACVPLTKDLESLLKNLPPPQNDEERETLNNTFESFNAMHESALSEHADVAKLLKGLTPKSPKSPKLAKVAR